MRIADATDGLSGTSRTAGFDASHEIAFSTRKAAPRSGTPSDQLTGWSMLADPSTTARGPWGASARSLGPSLAIATTRGPGRSVGVRSGPSKGHLAAPVTFVTPNALDVVVRRSVAAAP